MSSPARDIIRGAYNDSRARKVFSRATTKPSPWKSPFYCVVT